MSDLRVELERLKKEKKELVEALRWAMSKVPIPIPRNRATIALPALTAPPKFYCMKRNVHLCGQRFSPAEGRP